MATLHPSLQALSEAVGADPALRMLCQQMFDQISLGPRYEVDPYGDPQVRSFEQALWRLDVILRKAPPFNKSKLVGLPINAVFDWAMGTEAGRAVFLHPLVNRHLREILRAWAEFLGSAESCHVLDDDPRSGWFGADARAAMPRFEQEFICDPALPHHGFTSWDDFFTRRFRPGVRPLAAPDDDAVITNACESAPYRLVTGVKRRQPFWIKAQPYSLDDMLNDHSPADDGMAARFDGGTVYQAFLSAFSYHRWHSPVSGRVVRTDLIEGTYYAESAEQGYDESAPRESQAYITQLATRACVYIEADHPGIGLMCIVFVGMAEISSCDIAVKPGQRVVKGEEIGMFHFGGSTHCLLFRPGVKLDFDLHGQRPNLEATPIPLHAAIARVAA